MAERLCNIPISPLLKREKGEPMSEQRLIDANELPVSSIDAVDVDKYYAKYGTGIPVVLLSDIEHAPTIEERKTGKWICSDDLYETAICPFCGWDTTEPYGHIRSWFRYCPRCGARLVQEGEDNGKAD